MQVANMVSAKGNKVANQFVISHGDNLNTVTFQSYKSKIATVQDSHSGRHVVLFPHWNYSRTTVKYLHQFLRDNIGFSVSSKEIEKALETGLLSSSTTIEHGFY